MGSPLGVGLHILYGRKSKRKTNYAIGEILCSTTYKKCVLNVPLNPEFKDTKKDISFVEFKKLEPEKVIRLIDEEHQDTLFIVDEAQMVLLSANKLLVDSFVKKMSQIRQNNQCVVVIAQISKMLPNSIKDLAESCFFFENNNVKGLSKSSKVKHYRTGYDYTTRLIETFTFSHVYGLYESTNTPTTEKPKNLYKRTYIKMALIFGSALLLFVFVFYKFYSFVSDKTEPSAVVSDSSVSSVVESRSVVSVDSFCVRSWHYMGNSVVHYIDDSGIMGYIPLSDFSQLKKCSLYPNDTDKIKK